jgi:TPR repeat protein
VTSPLEPEFIERWAEGAGVEQVAHSVSTAEQGDADAQINLGVMYFTGRGVPQDYAAPTSWYRKAAEQGDAGAQYRLGVMYAYGHGVPKDYTSAHMSPIEHHRSRPAPPHHTPNGPRPLHFTSTAVTEPALIARPIRWLLARPIRWLRRPASPRKVRTARRRLDGGSAMQQTQLSEASFRLVPALDTLFPWSDCTLLHRHACIRGRNFRRSRHRLNAARP